MKCHSQCTVIEEIISTPYLLAAAPGSPGLSQKCGGGVLDKPIPYPVF